MTVQDALRACGLEPREARLLLAEASGLSEASVLAFPERVLSSEQEQRYRDFAVRRAAGEPIAYIVGHKEFYGLDLAVEAAVLVPRPETELLVDLALEEDFRAAADIGTGSGAIALALKKHRPGARVVAVEASAAALSVARRNAAKHGLEIELLQGRFLEALGAARFDLIVANLPYVRAGDPHLADLSHEPASALVGRGEDGLDDIRELVRQAPRVLAPGGRLLLEHGLGQEQAVRLALRQAGLESVATWPDLAGIARVSGGKSGRKE